MIKFETITTAAFKVIKRFPFSMIAALVGTASAYAIIHFDQFKDEWYLYRLLMTAALGFLIYMAIQLFKERQKLDKYMTYVIEGVAAVFLIGYYALLPENFDFATADFVIRFILFGLALLFSVTFAPFIKNLKEINGFWQYNKTLFIRFFFTFVFTGVLYLGLVLALFASEQLLEFNFDEKLYFEMWILVVGFITTSFFLAGVPEKTQVLEKKIDYQKGIKVFAQYILIPLLIVYALILYTYTGKIIINWDWPEGMVSWLVIVFSLGSILTNFLLYPLIKKEDWVRIFSKIVYILIIPMTVVMYLAIKIRIDEYGVTEPRYYGMVLVGWFLLVAFYFIFSKKKNLIYIPISLFIITLISSTGPLSSMNISENSQFKRVEEVLVKNDLIMDGKYQKDDQELSHEDLATLSGGLDYLKNNHGYSSLQPWFKEDLDELNQKAHCYNGSCMMELMGLKYLDTWERKDPKNVRAPRELEYYVPSYAYQVLNIEGYKYLIQNFYISPYRDYEWEWTNEYYDFKIFVEGKFRVSLDKQTLTITKDGNIYQRVDLYPLIERLKKYDSTEVPVSELEIEEGNVSILISTLELNNGGEEIRYIQGHLFLKE